MLSQRPRQSSSYPFGRLLDEPEVSHLGMDLLRAQIIGDLLVEPIKFATQRQLPDGSNSQSLHGREAWSHSWPVTLALVPGGVAVVVTHTP